MTRTTYVFRNRDGGGVDIFEKGTEPPLEMALHNPLAGDRHYDGMQATDGTDISTRTKHREYMRANGLTTADDYTEHWSKAEKARNEYRTTGRGGAVTRDDIQRAVARLQNR